MAWAGAFGVPAGGREGTRFSSVVPAGAPVPTRRRLKLAPTLTHLFMSSELVFSPANAHTWGIVSFKSRLSKPVCARLNVTK